MTRVALEEPTRPTWSGDRLDAAAVRLDRDHGIDLVVTWPHVWLILPEEIRAEITDAPQALTRATTLAAWALLYLPLAAWWWPTALTAGFRTSTATGTYALLLKASTRLHTRDLVDHLGLDDTDTLTRHLTPTPPPPPPE
ncbi:hypothetical protein ACFTWS_06100 [Streptomyces sp. NPDC057027]|uniref:hypothetical protein n=1 Tax=Streptomyces sp. NPDC057027 TaxID=3346004 RepID=UPI003642AEFB